MKIVLKRNAYTRDLFLLFLFLTLILAKLQKISILGISVKSNISLPLGMMLYYYFKKAVLLAVAGSIKAFFIFLSSIFGLAIFLLAAYYIAYLLGGALNKLNISNYLAFWNWSSVWSSRIKTRHILIFLLVYSLVLRIAYLNAGLFHHDAVELALAVEKTANTGQLQPIVGYRYGLVLISMIAYWIASPLFQVKTGIILNYTTALFGSLAVVMLYLFVNELLNRRYIAFTSAILFSTTPIFLSISTYALGHAHSMFFILLSAHLFVKGIKSSSFAFMCISGLFLGFSMFIRFPEAIISLSALLLIYFFRNSIFEGNEEKPLAGINGIKQISAFFASFAIVLLAYYFTQGDTISHEASANKFLAFPDLASTLIVALMRSSTKLGFFLAIIGAAILLKQNKNLFAALFLWGLASFVFFLSFQTSTIRFLLIPLLVILTFSSIAIYRMKEKYGFIAPITLVTILAVMLISIHPVLAFRHSNSFQQELSKYGSLVNDNSLFYDYGDYTIFYDYYLGKGVRPCPLTDDYGEFTASMEKLNSAASSGKKIYMTQLCFAYGTDKQKQQLYEYLSKNYNFTRVHEFLVDDFHHAEIDLNARKYKIYLLERKANG